ncbi:MAG: ABC transporter permease [Anaerolineales bacterium]
MITEMDSIEATKNSTEKPSNSWTKKLAGVLKFREINVTIAFLILCLFFYWQSPDVFLKPANLAVIMRFVATFGLLAIGELFVIITGGIDLSVGSMTALTGVIVATLMVKGVGPIQALGIPLSIIIVFILASLVGLWHGFSVTKMYIPPFIITLGTWLMARGLAAYITRGYPIVFESDFPFLILGQGEIFQIPIMFIILVVIALISSFMLNSTTLGRHIYAIGGNIEAAILASRLGQGTPTVGTAYELWAIAAAVIGGTSLFGGEGSVFGVILGAAIMGVMINGMVLLNISSYLQNVILGIVLVIAVTYDTLRRYRSK